MSTNSTNSHKNNYDIQIMVTYFSHILIISDRIKAVMSTKVSTLLISVMIIETENDRKDFICFNCLMIQEELSCTAAFFTNSQTRSDSYIKLKVCTKLATSFKYHNEKTAFKWTSSFTLLWNHGILYILGKRLFGLILKKNTFTQIEIHYFWP